jgi:hypothetical protein
LEWLATCHHVLSLEELLNLFEIFGEHYTVLLLCAHVAIVLILSVHTFVLNIILIGCVCGIIGL